MKIHRCLFIFSFFVLIISSLLPMSYYIEDQNTTISKLLSTPHDDSETASSNAKITDIVNPKSTYQAGDEIEVKGNVDQFVYLREIYGDLGFEGLIWYMPLQEIEVYINENPCESRDEETDQCIPSTSSIEDYKLSDNGINSTFTNGTDGPDLVNGMDDYLESIGLGTLDSGDTQEDIDLANETTKYDFTVTIPDSSDWSSLGITGGSTVIYEFFPGNMSEFGLEGWTLKSTTITLSSKAHFNVKEPTNPTFTPSESTDIEFTALLGDGITPIDNARIDFKIDYIHDDGVTIIDWCTGTAPGSIPYSDDCSSLGFDVQRSSELTSASGIITFTVSVIFDSSYGIAKEGNYNFTGNAIFLTSNTTTNKGSGTIYNLSENADNTTQFTIIYNQVNFGVISKSPTDGKITPDDTLSVGYEANITGSISMDVDGAFIDYNITKEDETRNCTRELGDCIGIGFDVQRTSDVTNPSGQMIITIDFLFGPALEGIYNFNAEAQFVTPNNQTTDRRVNPYFITENVTAITTQFEVIYPLSDGTIDKQDYSSMEMFPITYPGQTGTPPMRPGDNFTSSIIAEVSNPADPSIDGDPVQNVALDFYLYDEVDTNLTNQFGALGFSINYPGASITDASGLITFRLDSSSTTPLGTYRLEVLGD
ncbi:MAG: hypothetical protein ACXAC7_14035, partial [Candidatus Hodarchaeales archaeon]